MLELNFIYFLSIIYLKLSPALVIHFPIKNINLQILSHNLLQNCLKICFRKETPSETHFSFHIIEVQIVKFFYQKNIQIIFSFLPMKFDFLKNFRRIKIKKYDESIQGDTVQAHICGLCLNDYSDDDDLIFLRCGHHFHLKCHRKFCKENFKCHNCRKRTFCFSSYYI